MTSDTRAQRLVDEFEISASLDSGFGGIGFSIRHGIAAVLEHLCDTEDVISYYLLKELAAALAAPTLMERAMAGDATAARQFLHEAGFTDKRGQWLPQYQPTPEATND
jgi:hypothetical protein